MGDHSLSSDTDRPEVPRRANKAAWVFRRDVCAHFHAPAAGEAGGVPEVSAYARGRGMCRRRATRRRSRRAATRATTRRATQITRSIMVTGRTAHTVPATHSVVFLDLSGPCLRGAEHGPSHHGLRADISRQGES